MFYLSAGLPLKHFPISVLTASAKILSTIRENIRFSGSDVLREAIARGIVR